MDWRLSQLLSQVLSQQTLLSLNDSEIWKTKTDLSRSAPEKPFRGLRQQLLDPLVVLALLTEYGET